MMSFSSLPLRDLLESQATCRVHFPLYHPVAHKPVDCLFPSCEKRNPFSIQTRKQFPCLFAHIFLVGSSTGKGSVSQRGRVACCSRKVDRGLNRQFPRPRLSSSGQSSITPWGGFSQSQRACVAAQLQEHSQQVEI